MGVESIKGAAMTYQGSSLAAELKEESEHKAEVIETLQTSNDIAEETMAMNTKETGTEDDRQNAAAGQQAEESKIKKAIEEINKKANNSEAVFGIHSETNRVMIKIVDKQTKKVIKEFPPEKTLDMISKVWEMAGLMVDEKR